MKHYKLENMIGGWFVGAFSPNVYETHDCEVALKKYKKGDKESSHFHKIATEITLVVSGKIKMKDREWVAGDIIVLEPGESTAFEAITDASNVVVKLPGALNDKYVIDNE